MKCVICRTGDTTEGVANITLNRGETTVLIKDVPAQICDNCGEYYLDNEVTNRVMSLGDIAVENDAIIGMLEFAA